MKINLNDITIDPAVAIREGTDDDTIQRYMDNFDELPPIIVYQTDHKYLLADGFHRWAAATRLGHSDIEAEIHHGDYKEASEAAIYANLKHGKPLSREEYKTALRRLQMLHPDWGRIKLSRALQRSESFIEDVINANHVRQVLPDGGHQVDDATLKEIHRLDKSQWSDVGQAAIEQDWTRDETREKVREIKANPERIDDIIRIQPPIHRQIDYESEYYSEPEYFDIQDIVYTMNGYFADIAEQRIKYHVTKETLKPYATDIYTWRDAVNELIKILED